MNTEEIKNLLSGTDDKLYAWLVDEDFLDLHKYYKLLYYVKSDKILRPQIIKFLRQNKLLQFISNFITKGMIEFYKNKPCYIYNCPYDPETRYFETCGVNRDYSYGFTEKLNKDGIRYILHSSRNNKYSSYDKNTSAFIKFLIKCKELGYNKQKFISLTKIREEFYDKVDNGYYKYLVEEKTLQKYLLTKDSLSCMSFIDALRTSAADLETNEIIISVDTINEIYEKANLNKHLNEK